MISKGQTKTLVDCEFTAMSNTKRAPLPEEAVWKELQSYFDSEGSQLNMMKMFQDDATRFDKFR